VFFEEGDKSIIGKSRKGREKRKGRKGWLVDYRSERAERERGEYLSHIIIYLGFTNKLVQYLG